MEPTPPQLLTAAEVAARLSISTTAVYSLCESGQLAAYRIGSGKKKPRYRIAPDALAEYLERVKVQPPGVVSKEDKKPRRTGPPVKLPANGTGFSLLRAAGGKV